MTGRVHVTGCVQVKGDDRVNAGGRERAGDSMSKVTE